MYKPTTYIRGGGWNATCEQTARFAQETPLLQPLTGPTPDGTWHLTCGNCSVIFTLAGDDATLRWNRRGFIRTQNVTRRWARQEYARLLKLGWTKF